MKKRHNSHSKWLFTGTIFLLPVPLLALLLWPQLPGNYYQTTDKTRAELTAQPLCAGETRFAIIGDYGWAGPDAAAVAALVDSWFVDFIITTGDNNYPDGAAATIDDNIGQYYADYIAPYRGSYGPGAAENRFFPVPGNHDWNTGSLDPYQDYFILPHNERYYSFTWGPVDFFMLDSDPREPDGITADSAQAAWLAGELAAGTAVWKLVVAHHPPYSSSARHGSIPEMQWPYAAWGVTAVLAGHDHTYERLLKDNVYYFVNGLGGRNIYPMGTPLPESQVRFNQDFGAMLVQADPACITFRFFDVQGDEIDRLTLYNPDFLPEKLFLPLTMQR